MPSKQILAINCGSSSIKVSLFEYNKKWNRVCDANLKEINSSQPSLEITGKQKTLLQHKISISDGLETIFNALSLPSVMAIGHRVVHGGNKYRSPILVNKKILNDLQKVTKLAPLHNAACLQGINSCLSMYKKIPEVVVFDTSFHRTLPPEAAFYAIPQNISKKYQIERYGFHGISHKFLWEVYSNQLSRKKQAKIITLHLGNGCSMTAIKNGRSIETSMGFTPEEGLIMGTRAGDIDPSIMEFLCSHQNKTPTEIMSLFNFKSGLLGISELSGNMRVLLENYESNANAKLAIDMFCYRIVKYLGAYIALLGGTDSIIFSAGIGENCPLIRKKVIEKMAWYGLKIDSKANQGATQLPPGKAQLISSNSSSIPIFVVATDENFMIAKETYQILENKTVFYSSKI